MKRWNQGRTLIVGTGVVILLAVLVWYTKKDTGFKPENGGLWRQQNGEGEYETELILEIDGTVQTEIMIIVPEQHLSEETEKRYLSLAVEEIDAEFQGENESLEAVQNAVSVAESYQEGKVLAEWSFSNARLIAADGRINEEAMAGKEEEITATVYLTCEDSSLVHEFCFIVCKSKKSKEEIFYEKLHQLIEKSGEAEGEEFIWLPTTLEGHMLNWKKKESPLPVQVFFLGMVIVLLLPALEKEREKEIKEKRRTQLMQEYPDMVNKLALLLGAGMTLQGAWKQIITKYTEELSKKENGRRIVYEEMLITQREIESGKGEVKAYEAFGERCELQRYRKLSSYLIQNLKKGNRKLCNFLEQEAVEAFAERKSMAQQYGEEVGTKLLLPMLMMLGIVIVIIMVPAVISFQAGIS